MSFFNLWVAARELSLGEGAGADDEDEEEKGKALGAAEEEDARLEAVEEDRDVFCRLLEVRLVGSAF